MQRSIWFARFVLAASAALMTTLAIKYIGDPVGAVADHGIQLSTADAITSMRVNGGLFLAVAICLVACLVSAKRLLVGLGFLVVIATTLLAVRLIGLGVDGPAPFTLRVLKPEVVLAVLSAAAFIVERARSVRAV